MSTQIRTEPPGYTLALDDAQTRIADRGQEFGLPIRVYVGPTTLPEASRKVQEFLTFRRRQLHGSVPANGRIALRPGMTIVRIKT